MADLQSNPAAGGRDACRRDPACDRPAPVDSCVRWRSLSGCSFRSAAWKFCCGPFPCTEAPGRYLLNEENPVIRFEPNREFVWSRDWNFSIVNDVRINNFGFVSDCRLRSCTLLVRSSRSSATATSKRSWCPFGTDLRRQVGDGA